MRSRGGAREGADQVLDLAGFQERDDGKNDACLSSLDSRVPFRRQRQSQDSLADIGEVNPNQGYVWAPNSEVRVEVFGDPSLPGEVSMDHVHLYPREADIPAMQAWYAKVFGGFPGQRQRVARPGVIDVDYFGRFNLSFSAATAAPQPTRGHGIDHIGFDVKDIDAFAKRLEGMGLKFDAPPRQAGTSSARVAFLTDPWGTYIEVTEKLAPPPS